MAIANKTEKLTQKRKPAQRTKMKLVEKQEKDAIRTQMIAEAAYFRAENRNFQNGDASQDWIEAEREIDQLFNLKQVN